ncbi:MAG: hypothetical protein LWX11_05360, partial [Firmicutes bacterium]|nr:hypothetical protein [Bacillota bacterium]
MLLPLLVPLLAFAQPAPLAMQAPAPISLPPGFDMPLGLRVKPDSLEVANFDEEVFEVKAPGGAAPVRLTREGRTWRFSLMPEQGRMGLLALQERLRSSMTASGWVWTYEERGVARKTTEEHDVWIKIAAVSSGEVKLVALEPKPLRTLILNPPGPTPELPKAQEDFPYLPPWPGSRIVSCADSPNPVGVELEPGKPAIVRINFIEKEYELAEPVTPHEFLSAYTRALKKAGWEIDGKSRGKGQGTTTQIQAAYLLNGRDVRATLRLLGGSMAISV